MKIGTLCYVVDNSYSFNKTLNQGSNILLAGTINRFPVQVKVMSEPYQEKVNNIINEVESCEFVDVEYKNNIYRVLNNLSLTFDEFDHQGFEDDY